MKLLPSLLADLKAIYAAFPDPRKGRGGNIAMADFGLSAFAMFFMQSASFLSFQRALEKGQGRSHCQSLYGIEKIPSEALHHDEKVRKGKTTDTFRYRWFEAVPLRDGKDAMPVSWIGFEIIDAKGRVKYSMAWVTSLPVTKQNVAEIVACGRTRWKIENEGFNVMKNHGYELEHNFGHGARFLAMTLASLNLLAFAWHTVLELLEPPWIGAREAATQRTSFFAHLATLTGGGHLRRVSPCPRAFLARRIRPAQHAEHGFHAIGPGLARGPYPRAAMHVASILTRHRYV